MKEGDIMEEFILDVLLLAIGLIIGYGFRSDQIEDDQEPHYPYFKRRK